MIKKFVNWWIQDEEKRKKRRESTPTSFLSSVDKNSYTNDSDYKHALKMLLLARLDVDISNFSIDKHISIGSNSFRSILGDSFFLEESRFEFLIDDVNKKIAIFTLNKSIKSGQIVDVHGKIYSFENIQDFKLDERNEEEICHSMHLHIFLNDLQELKLSLQLIYPALFGTRKTDELYIQRTKEANELIAVLKYIKRVNKTTSFEPTRKHYLKCSGCGANIKPTMDTCEYCRLSI